MLYAIVSEEGTLGFHILTSTRPLIMTVSVGMAPGIISDQPKVNVALT